MKTLFTGADILTMNAAEEWECLRNGYLGVDGDTIVYVGKERPAERYDTERNFSGKLLLPGLVNTHCHSPMTLLRGIGSDRPLHEWLTKFMFPTEDRLRPQDIRTGSYLALLEMLSTGTTSFSDMYYICDETVDACLEAGIKANIARPVQAFDPDEPCSKNYRAREAVDLFRRRNGDGNGRIRIDFSIHAEYTCTEHVVRDFCAETAPFGGRMHIHMSETFREHEECLRKYGRTPCRWFYDCGVFSMPAFAAHCVAVSEEDMDLMRECSVAAVHNPTSNMKLGSGFAPVERMREKGILVGLGTDGAASNNDLNMFEELHLASVIHNGYMRSAEVMQPAYTLKMATVNGARIQGRSDTGMLRPGFKADVIAVDMDTPRLYPNPDPLAALCYSVQGSDVVMTMVDGKVLYENGEFKTLDADRIYALARESCRYLYA